MSSNEFGGDKKVGESILTKAENKFKRWAVPKIPQQIETYHLTGLTLLWSAVNVGLGFLAQGDLKALWGVSLMIFLQYVSDLFDGELGRQRNTGLVKWGFYMDHFLDFLFLSSIVFVGYMISPDGLEPWYFGLLVVMGSFMVNSFLSFAVTNEFEISQYGIGPTEMRIVFILVNTYIIYFGTKNFRILVPSMVFLCLTALILNTYQIQKKLWEIDMADKEAKS
jgi:archaetidylinositol phosphate synthase